MCPPRVAAGPRRLREPLPSLDQRLLPPGRPLRPAPGKPFPRPSGSDTICVVLYPSGSFNPFYPAGPAPLPLVSPVCDSPDRSLFVRQEK